MVKHTKRAKITSDQDVAMMAKTAAVGVCTRAKAMALKKSSFTHSTSTIVDDGCYLQLRSRRLKRLAPRLAKETKKNKWSCKERDILRKENVGINFKKEEEILSTKVEGENEVVQKKAKEIEIEENNKNDERKDFDEKEKGSFGENYFDFENNGSHRIATESTPNRFIVGSNIIKTPMSSNKATTNVDIVKEMENEVPIMLRAEEVEECFVEQKTQQIEEFIKKYNFDPVKDKPLKGRYEWEKIKP